MKILQILPEFHAGGVEDCTLQFARYLATHGHESIVVSNGGQLVAQLESEGSRHIAMPVHRKSPASLAQVRPLRRLIQREKPDIVHYRSRVPGWITWLAWRGMPQATRPRFVSTIHGFYSVNAYSAVMAKGEKVICVSNSIREYALRHYPMASPENLHVIYEGLDLGGYGPHTRPDHAWLRAWHASHPQLTGKTVLLLPGRITRLKGHGDFFRLIGGLKARGHAVHGLVAGDTHPDKRAYLNELHAEVRAAGLAGDVTFLGHRSDLRDVMHAADIVCSLSRQPEAFGRTVLESLAIGKPVAGYDRGGVGEQLERFFPAGRVPPGDTAALVDVCEAIIREKPAPGPVGEPFTIESMCRSTVRIYESLCGGHAPPTPS